MDRVLKGRKAEEIAVKFLRKKGYKIVERNWRFKRDEVDIIAVDRDGYLCFVEVRSRSNSEFVLPEETITKEKRKNIIRVAKAYIQKNNIDKDVRFDVVSILNGEIKLLRDAFRL
ncbi:MAG: YraN family protein [Caldiserica bacterium]|nr:MAG: YraN family protein [Caldisericota bacterium]